MTTYITSDKNILKSKVFYLSLIQLTVGFLIAYRGLVTGGLTLILFAILFIALRLYTTTGVFLRDGSYKP